MVAVLFVCLGNICRSPAGEALLKHLVELEGRGEDIVVSSCGLGSWHVGQLAHEKMRQAVMDRGIVLSTRAKQFEIQFFDDFDMIFAADLEVMQDLYKMAKTTEHKAKIHLITAFSPSYTNEEVPDPYYGNLGDFHLVLDMLQDACEGIFQEVKKRFQ